MFEAVKPNSDKSFTRTASVYYLHQIIILVCTEQISRPSPKILGTFASSAQKLGPFTTEYNSANHGFCAGTTHQCLPGLND